MNIDDVRLAGEAMFPPAPTFTGGLQECDYRFPLSGCPKEIHPKSVPITIKSPQFFPFGGGLVEIPGYRPGDYSVTGWIIHHHEIVTDRPKNPDLQVIIVPESLGVIGML
jgi:hypothetical protein